MAGTVVERNLFAAVSAFFVGRKSMIEYYEKRKQELTQALIQQWAVRGQASMKIEEADKQIKLIEHRLDEIERSIQAEKAAQVEAKKKAKQPKEI